MGFFSDRNVQTKPLFDWGDSNQQHPLGRTPGPGAPGWGENVLQAQPVTKTATNSATNSTTIAPQQDSTLKDLTQWMQDRFSIGSHNLDNWWLDQGQAAQQAQQGAYDTYQQALNGMRGLFGNLTDQANQGWGQQQAMYNQAQQALSTGQVPQALQEQYQKNYDAQLANVNSELDRMFGISSRQLGDSLGAFGNLNSQTAANALSQLGSERMRQGTQAANTAAAAMAQQMSQAPFDLSQGLSSLAGLYGQGLLGNLGQQGQWGSTSVQATQPLQEMAGNLAAIPTAMRQGYLDPLQQMWSDLLGSATQIETTNIAADASSSDDDDWLTGIGNIVGSIGGLF